MSKVDVNSAVAEEIMTPHVIMLNSKSTFQDVITTLHENDITAVFIHDDTIENYYIISQKEIIRFLNDGGMLRKNIAQIPVTEIMRGPIDLVDFDTPVDKIIRFMTERKYKRILISKEGKAVGVVSTRDIMKWNNTYFKPARPQMLLFMDNFSSNFIARHVFNENIDDKIENDLIDLYGGALHAISTITNEIIKKSGKLYNLMKDKRSILFEPYNNITGILVCDYNSIELRRKLQIATRKFYNSNKELMELGQQRGGLYMEYDISTIIPIFEN